MCALGGDKAHDGGIYAVSTDLCCGTVTVAGPRPCLQLLAHNLGD